VVVAVTVTVAVPLTLPLVATMFVVPAAKAVTTPLAETEPTAGDDDDHVTDRPDSTFPDASRRVAVACVVCPTTSDDDESATVTLLTGTSATVSVRVPLFPSLVAVSVTLPAASPVTSPLGETVASAVFDDVQPMVRPVRTFPAASLSVAVTCSVAPTSTVLELADRVTVATGAGAGAATVTVAPPLWPSLVATIDAEPALTAVATPVDDTVTTSGFALDHVMVRPVSVLPAASRRTAVACVVWPTASDADVSVTDTDATGVGGDAAIVTATEAVIPSTTADTLALPAVTAVTSPVAPTVAIAGLELDQVTARSVRIAPDASRTVADAREVSPTMSVRLVGDTVTDAAGTDVTATGASAVSPSADACTDVCPTVVALTMPVELTGATDVFLLDHVIV
jgi:hypothetical protein